MNKGNLYAASLAVVVALLLAGCSALRVPSGQAQGEPGVSIAKAAPAGGPSEGIKVHGHWLIEVRNPDGSLASRTEFENALVIGDAGGSGALARVLSREITVGLWSITLSGFPLTPCSLNCFVTESNSPAVQANIFKTLTVARKLTAVVLAGTATVANNTSINGVSTAFIECAPSTPPASTCVSGGQFEFTQTTVAVPVVAGQQVQVTVTLSFS